MSLALVALLAASQTASTPSATPVEIARKWKPGDKFFYTIKSELTEETRSGDLQTFLPTDTTLEYQYTIDVKKLKADGIAEVIYKRPTMKVTEGDTMESAAKTETVKFDYNLQLDVSPYNEFTGMKDLNPPKPEKPEKSGGGAQQQIFIRAMKKQGSMADQAAYGLAFQFLQELQRLALFIGTLDSSLDFAPKTPFNAIKIGATWKKTVGYQPQKLKGQGDKQAVQRLDYTYTYLGPMKDSKGKPIERISAVVKLETDVSEYARQLVGSSRASSFIKSVPLKFESQVNFDLEPKTFNTLKAVATAKGGVSIEAKGSSQPIYENRFSGKTKLTLDKVETASAKKTSK